MLESKRPRLSLILSFACCILGLVGIAVIGLCLPTVMTGYLNRFVPSLLSRHMLIVAVLYVALAIALTVIVLLLFLLNVVRKGRIFTPISGKLVFAIACLVILEGGTFGVLGALFFPLAYTVCFVAVTMGLCLMVVSGVLKEATAIKDENDQTI